jgi:2-polyprenyl-6-hydroxyphenyl methylase/3-demethylubiquinone-9 3-methyltransferase
MFPVTNPSVVSCKLCAGAAPLFGVVDFNKTCLEFDRKKLPLSGIPIYYRRCQQCGFLFTTAFDDWSPRAFIQHIYNADYHIIDPECELTRPTNNLAMVDEWLSEIKSQVRILDYGGGNGKLAELLRGAGYAAESYDPYTIGDVRPSAQFNVITCFEVMEHSHTPRMTVADLSSFLAKDGIIILSTSVQSADFEANGLNWWYVAPRNGHVSIHSRASLARLFGNAGCNVVTHAGNNYHLAFASLPPFVAGLRGRTPSGRARLMTLFNMP